MSVWRRIGLVACALGAAATLGVSDPACAGAFLLREGEAKIFVTGYTMSGDKYFDRRGRLRSRGRYEKFELQTFVEYGLSERLTVFGAIGLQKIKARDGGEHDRNGLGRSEIGARIRIAHGNDWVASVQASGVLAGAKKSDGLAAIGETDDQIDVRGLVARSFEIFGKPAFVDVAAGFRARGGDPADEIRIDAALGVRPSPRWLLIAQSFNAVGTGRWRGPYRLKQRSSKTQIAVLYDLTERLSMYFAGFVTPAGRDVLNERGATLGFGYRF